MRGGIVVCGGGLGPGEVNSFAREAAATAAAEEEDESGKEGEKDERAKDCPEGDADDVDVMSRG